MLLTLPRIPWLVPSFAYLLAMLPGVATASDGPFYSASTCITGIDFDMSTLSNVAPGTASDPLRAPESDNWIMTWGDDGYQYTSWGDGWGFLTASQEQAGDYTSHNGTTDSISQILG